MHGTKQMGVTCCSRYELLSSEEQTGFVTNMLRLCNGPCMAGLDNA